MRVPRRCSTPWRRSALPPTSSLARTLYWPHCLRHTLNVSNAYPLPAPSSHWGFHVADAARRGVTMCSALPPPTSSLACTFVSHFIILLPAPSTSTQSTLPQPRPCRVLPPLTSTWGFHVADAAHRGITMPSVCPTPFNISNAYPIPISNAYPIPAPSSHWEFHVADAARRGVTMCSALPPTSSLACTLYWRHVPLPPRVNLHTGTIGPPFLVSPTSLLPAPSTSTPSTLPWVVSVASSSSPLTSTASSRPLTSTWGFHVADAAHRGMTMPSVSPHPLISLMFTPSLPPPHIGNST